MGTHVLDVGDAPTVNPAGASPDDYQKIDASPDAFGASVGKATEGLGQAVTGAADTALDVQTQRQQMQNEIHASDMNTWLSNAITDRYSQQQKLQGQDAINALPQFKSDIHDLYSSAVAQAGNAQSQVLIAKSGAVTTDQFYKYATNHADEQSKVWQDQSDTLHAADQGSQSTTAALEGDLAASDAYLTYSNNVIRLQAHQRSLDPAATEQLVRSNTGSHVMNTVQQMAISGKSGTPDIPSAEAYFKKYHDQMDVTSQLHTEEWLKSRTSQYDGQQAGKAAIAAATGAHRYTDPTLPIFASAASAQPNSMSPQGMARVVQIESGGNPNAVSPGGRNVGLVQAGDAYWQRYGDGSRLDPQQSVLALGRSTAADRPVLAQALGRQPTDAELYLSHQQGVGGAKALLSHPEMPAAQALVEGGAYGNLNTAISAIKGNGGDPNAPAAVFTQKWIDKFNGTKGVSAIMPASVAGTYHAPFQGAVGDPMAASAGVPPVPMPNSETPTPQLASIEPIAPVAATAPPQAAAEDGPTPLTIKSAAYQHILDDQTLTDDVKQHALTYIGQQITAQQIAGEADAKSKSDASNTAANNYVTRIGNGDVKDIFSQINNDKHLTWETKRALEGMVTKIGAGDDEAKSYGSGFWPAYKAATASPGTPGRISDPVAIMQRAGPDGDLSLAGAQKIMQIMRESARSTDDAAVNQTKASLIGYAKSKLSFDQDMLFPGAPPMRDPKGAQLFNAQFVPKFEAAYDQWIKAGKNPWDFLQQDNVDKMVKGMRSPVEMAQAKIAAGSASSSEPAPAALPPPPANVDPQAWSAVLAKPPGGASQTSWNSAVSMLMASPTPNMIAQFNASRFGKAGMDGAKLISQMRMADADAGARP